jgi:hypothetical protein
MLRECFVHFFVSIETTNFFFNNFYDLPLKDNYNPQDLKKMDVLFKLNKNMLKVLDNFEKENDWSDTEE